MSENTPLNRKIKRTAAELKPVLANEAGLIRINRIPIDLWQRLEKQLTPVQELVFDVASKDAIDIEQTHAALFKARQRAYEEALQDALENAKCTGQVRLSERSVLAELNDVSRRDAESIVATYNKDLETAITFIATELPTANRNTYYKRLRDWDAERSSWKSVQIAGYTEVSARNKASADFFNLNELEGRARLVGPPPVCPVCEGWMKRGWIDAREAAQNSEIFHVNCWHGFEYKLRKVRDCESLWLGGSLAKHLPGQHEQQRHAGGKGSLADAIAQAKASGVNIAHTKTEQIDVQWKHFPERMRRDRVEQVAREKRIPLEQARQEVKEGFYKNWDDILDGSEASEQETLEIVEGINKARAMGQAGPVDVIIRKDHKWEVEKGGSNAYGTYYVSDGDLASPNENLKPGYMVLRPQEHYPGTVRLGQGELVTASDSYDNHWQGVFVHEYGHHWSASNSNSIERARVIIDQGDRKDWINTSISWYASTNHIELVAEAYALKQNPDFSMLPQETKSFVDTVLGSPVGKHLPGQHEQQRHGNRGGGLKLKMSDGKPVPAKLKQQFESWASRHDPKAVAAAGEVVIYASGADFVSRAAQVFKVDRSQAAMVLGWQEPRNDTIHVKASGDALYRQTFDHEIGHAVFNKSKNGQTWADRYYDDDRFDRHTHYARSSSTEGFAESYMAYIGAGGKAQDRKLSDTFSVVSSVIEGL